MRALFFDARRNPAPAAQAVEPGERSRKGSEDGRERLTVPRGAHGSVRSAVWVTRRAAYAAPDA
jgi:hypothetical protein